MNTPYHPPVKRSVEIAGHKTSVSLEPVFWDMLRAEAAAELVPVNALGPDVDPEDQLEIHYKPEETPITLAAKKSYMGRVYLDWAQYPITETEKLESPQQGYIVRFQDLRFVQLPGAFIRRGRKALGAGVLLDQRLHVLGDVFGEGEKQVVEREPGSGGK